MDKNNIDWSKGKRMEFPNLEPTITREQREAIEWYVNRYVREQNKVRRRWFWIGLAAGTFTSAFLASYILS